MQKYSVRRGSRSFDSHVLLAPILALLVTLGLGAAAHAQTGTLFVEGDRVGIGTPTPAVPLHIKDVPDTSVVRLERAGPSRIEFRDTAGGVSWDFRTTSGDTFVITKVGTGINELKVNSLGDLVIPGSVMAEGGDGSLDSGDIFPDFVFEPDYELRPLSEVARFVESEKHLPDVMSIEDVRAEGSINMTKLQLQLLRKVEELTLYVVQQQREIQDLRARLAASAGGSASVSGP